MPKQIIIPATQEQTRYRVIEQINYVPSSHILLKIMLADLVDGVLVLDFSKIAYFITISGDAYIELLSANPVWNVNKAENYYNEDDLWYIIGEIESGKLK